MSQRMTQLLAQLQSGLVARWIEHMASGLCRAVLTADLAVELASLRSFWLFVWLTVCLSLQEAGPGSSGLPGLAVQIVSEGQVWPEPQPWAS